MQVTRALGFAAVLVTSACIGPITEYSEDASDDPMGDGDGAPTETGEPTGDDDDESGNGDDDSGDGDGDSGDGDGDSGDGDGDCVPGSPDCACDKGECDAGYECVTGMCEPSGYPWGKCGWDPRNEWYDCGFQGASPNPKYPIDCGNLPLVSGAPCPMEFGIEGCCAVGGDSWWCEAGFVERKVCGV